MPKECEIDSCSFPVFGGGYCHRHQHKRTNKRKHPVKRPVILKISKKRQDELTTYRKLREQFLVENPHCAVHPHLPATEIHHRKGRGKYLNVVSTWLAVSRIGHEWIEMHPVEAKEKGWSVSRLAFCESCGNVEPAKKMCSVCLHDLTAEK